MTFSVFCYSEILLPWQRDETTTPVYCLRRVAWDQILLLGEKVKKIIGERSEPSSSLGRRKGAAALSPCAVHRSARFARRFFFCRFTPFFAILPHSRGPGYSVEETASELRLGIYRFAVHVFKKKLNKLI